MIIKVFCRSCKWALDKLKSKEIKSSQLVRCALKGTSSIICCKDDSAPKITTTKTIIRTNDFVLYVKVTHLSTKDGKLIHVFKC